MESDGERTGRGMSQKINSIYAIDGYNGTIGDTQSSLGVNCGISTGRNGVMLITEAYGICSYESNAMLSDNPHSGIYKASTARTLNNNGGNPACNQGGMAIVDSNGKEGDVMNDVQYRVRRLTPLECERLQGFPDGWTDIGEEIEVEVKDYEYQTETRELPDGGYEDVERKVCVGTHKEVAKYWRDSKDKLHKLSDAPRYRALGNSIALPYWRWMTQNMAKYLPENATLGSLFDGIGGFPLIWEEIHGKGTARWASEIEEFPIAVTKYHFGED